MEMVADLWQCRHGLCKFLRHHIRLNGAEANPLNSFHLMHLLENIQKRGIPSVLAVACHMDTRQHNLFKAVLRQTLYLSHNLLRLSAADRASRIGNDAVGAILATPILNFQIGSCSVCQLLNGKRLKYTLLHNIGNVVFHAVCPVILLHHFHNLRSVLRSDDQVHACNLHQLLGCGLRIAADNRHNGIFILPLYLTNQLTGFLVPEIRHRAGIDDIHIRFFINPHNFIALFCEQLRNGFALILIYLAAQCKTCCFLHIKTLLRGRKISFCSAALYYSSIYSEKQR